MRYTITVLLFFLQGLLHSQEKKNPITFLKSHDGFVYTDNSEGCYFSIDFKGDSLREAGIDNAYYISEVFHQVIKNPFSRSEYSNRDDSTKEIQLLKKKMESEVEYISKEMLHKKIESKFVVFKNKDRKNFFLWYYEMPDIEGKENVEKASWQFYLTFIANKKVVGIYTPMFPGSPVEQKIIAIKGLADRIDVFGNKIDLDALYYKLDAAGARTDLAFTDSVNGYKFIIYEWMNVTESTSDDYFIATLSDFDNIQNAILVKEFKKTGFASFNAFNEKIVPALKTGDDFNGNTFLLKKEVEKPANINGISYKISVLSGNTPYELQYATLETDACYLLLLFTATPETFNINQSKFIEFLNGVELIK